MMQEEGWRSVEDENENGNQIVTLDLAWKSLLSTKMSLKATESGKPEQEKKLRSNTKLLLLVFLWYFTELAFYHQIFAVGTKHWFPQLYTVNE